MQFFALDLGRNGSEGISSEAGKYAWCMPIFQVCELEYAYYKKMSVTF